MPHAERWSAHDTTLERDVVVVCFAEDDPHAAATLDAARRAAGLDNHRLVRVLDVGRSEGIAFFVEEAIHDAHTLTQILEQGGLPAEEARRIAGETATGLEAARGARPAPPARSRPTRSCAPPTAPSRSRGVATAAALAGVDDLDSTQAARVDAVGVVAIAYAALTSRWPLPGRVPGLEAAPHVVGGVPAPSEIAAGVPGDLDALCRLTLNEDEGPLTPGDFATQIAPWSLAAGQRPRRRRSPPPCWSRASPARTRRPPAAGARSAGGTEAPVQIRHRRLDPPRRPSRPQARRPRRGTRSPAAPAPPEPGAPDAGAAAAAGAGAGAASEPPPTTAAQPRRPTPEATPDAEAAGRQAPPPPRGCGGLGPRHRRARRRPGGGAPPTGSALRPGRGRQGGRAPGRPGCRGAEAEQRRISLDQALRRGRTRPLEPPLPMLPPETADPPSRDQSKLVLAIMAAFLVAGARLGFWGASRIGSGSNLDLGGAAPRHTVTVTGAADHRRPDRHARTEPDRRRDGGEAFAILSATGFDPEGDNAERNGEAARVFDGKTEHLLELRGLRQRQPRRPQEGRRRAARPRPGPQGPRGRARPARRLRRDRLRRRGPQPRRRDRDRHLEGQGRRRHPHQGRRPASTASTSSSGSPRSPRSATAGSAPRWPRSRSAEPAAATRPWAPSRCGSATTATCCAPHVDGDPDAFGELFRRHRDRMWAVALRTTRNRELAADCVQDAFISAFRRADVLPRRRGGHHLAAPHRRQRLPRPAAPRQADQPLPEYELADRRDAQASSTPGSTCGRRSTGCPRGSGWR